jgi:hypothetical protein
MKILKNKLNLEEDVKIEKSKDAIVESYQKSIKPLLDKIFAEFRKIESLFKSKNEHIQVITDSGLTKFPADSKSIVNTVKNDTSFTDNPKYIIYKYALLAPRKKLNADAKVEVTIVIHFHKLVYEIRSNETNFGISKLYHEIFTEEECQSIVEAFGSVLYEKIEAALK